MGFFSSKVNRESTSTEKALESSLSGEAAYNYAANNLADATAKVAESTPKGWSVNPWGRRSIDGDGMS
jgi:hypothetical protein